MVLDGFRDPVFVPSVVVCSLSEEESSSVLLLLPAEVCESLSCPSSEVLSASEESSHPSSSASSLSSSSPTVAPADELFCIRPLVSTADGASLSLLSEDFPPRFLSPLEFGDVRDRGSSPSSSVVLSSSSGGTNLSMMSRVNSRRLCFWSRFLRLEIFTWYTVSQYGVRRMYTVFQSEPVTL